MSNEIVISVEQIVDTIIRQLQNQQVVKLLEEKGYLVKRNGHKALNIFTISEYIPLNQSFAGIELIDKWQVIIKNKLATKMPYDFLDKVKPFLLDNNKMYFVYDSLQNPNDKMENETTELTNFLKEICNDKLEAKIVCSEKIITITNDDILFVV